MKRFSADESLSLIELFRNPFSQVDEITLSNDSEAEREIKTLEKQTEEQSDWDQKFNAIKRCMSLIKGGAMKYPSFDLNLIIPNIAQTVTDLRSTLVKWGSMFACAVSSTMGAKFVPYIDIYVLNLFKQATHGTAVISKSCHYAITQIVTNCPSRKTARVILDKLNDKSSARRLIVAESLQIMSNSWPHNIYSNVQSDITAAISKLKKDASVEVRNVFRDGASFSPVFSAPHSMAVSIPKSVEQTRVRLARHGSTPRERLTRERKPPLTERHSLASVPSLFTAALVKPHSEDEANLYIVQLTKHIDSNVPAVKRRMSKSIPTVFPAAVDLVPENKEIPVLVPKVLKKYKEEMKECICDILVSLELDEKITKAALETYGFEELISFFKNPADAVIFVIFVNNNFQGYVNESSLPVIKELLKSNVNKDSNFDMLEKIVEDLSPSTSEVVAKVLSAVKTGKFDEIEISILKEQKEDEIEEEFNNSTELPNMILEDGEVTYFTLSFLVILLENWTKLTLLSSLEALISILSDEKSLFKPLTEKILEKMLFNLDIKKEIVPYISKKSDNTLPVLLLLTEFLSKTSDSKVKELAEFLPDELLPFLKDKSVTIRRCAITCFAYFTQVCDSKVKHITSKLKKENLMLIDHFVKILKRE